MRLVLVLVGGLRRGLRARLRLSLYRRGHGHQVNEKRDVCGPSTMTEMPNDVLTELITAIVAARADGDGVLTIAAVRARLEAAKLYVARVEDEGTEGEGFSMLAS